MSQNLSRQFEKEVDGKLIKFDILYNIQTHHFIVTENGSKEYKLMFDPSTRSWTTAGSNNPSISVTDLATLVQKSYGVNV